MRVLLKAVTVTQGQYMGEEGTGYLFTAPGTTPDDLPHGDISHATQGHYQGYDGHAWGELADGWEITEAQSGEWLAFQAGGNRGYAPSELVYMGVLVIEGVTLNEEAQ